MLLAQPFDPFQNEQTQHKKLPLLARCRLISQRTKRVLCNLKNRAHTTSATTRGFPTMMLPDNRFMLTSPPHPPPQPWYGSYGGCYDPYLMMGPPPLPPPHPMHFPPMPHHQSMPYTICVHLTSSCPLENCSSHQSHYSSNARHQDSSSATESTLYSSASSLYNDDEKEQIEYDQSDRPDHYIRRSRSGSNITAAPSSLTRSNSDIIHDRQQYRQQRRRPYMQHRWSSQDEMYYQ